MYVGDGCWSLLLPWHKPTRNIRSPCDTHYQGFMAHNLQGSQIHRSTLSWWERRGKGEGNVKRECAREGDRAKRGKKGCWFIHNFHPFSSSIHSDPLSARGHQDHLVTWMREQMNKVHLRERGGIRGLHWPYSIHHSTASHCGHLTLYRLWWWWCDRLQAEKGRGRQEAGEESVCLCYSSSGALRCSKGITRPFWLTQPYRGRTQ